MKFIRSFGFSLAVVGLSLACNEAERYILHLENQLLVQQSVVEKAGKEILGNWQGDISVDYNSVAHCPDGFNANDAYDLKKGDKYLGTFCVEMVYTPTGVGARLEEIVSVKNFRYNP